MPLICWAANSFQHKLFYNVLLQTTWWFTGNAQQCQEGGYDLKAAGKKLSRLWR